jgi:hypothetical protein
MQPSFATVDLIQYIQFIPETFYLQFQPRTTCPSFFVLSQRSSQASFSHRVCFTKCKYSFEVSEHYSHYSAALDIWKMSGGPKE